jgi:hypothetical protein
MPSLASRAGIASNCHFAKLLRGGIPVYNCLATVASPGGVTWSAKEGRGPEPSNKAKLVPENTTAPPRLDLQSTAYDLLHACAPVWGELTNDANSF